MSEKEVKESERASQSSEEGSPRTDSISQISLPSDSARNEPSTSDETANIPEISISTTASPSKSSMIRKRVQSFFKNLGSKKDEDDCSSPKKSALSVVDLVASAVDVFRKSPEKSSLVSAGQSPPGPPALKAERENYHKIDTFVKREGKRDTGNATDSSALSTPSPSKTQASSPEEPSSAEESLLIKPDKPLKEQSSKKDKSYKK